MMVRLQTDQMPQSKRVNIEEELEIGLSLGYAKDGSEFADEDDSQKYIDDDTGDYFDFSQNVEGRSPETTWKGSGKNAELVQFMYTGDTYKLFYAYQRAC